MTRLKAVSAVAWQYLHLLLEAGGRTKNEYFTIWIWTRYTHSHFPVEPGPILAISFRLASMRFLRFCHYSFPSAVEATKKRAAMTQSIGKRRSYAMGSQITKRFWQCCGLMHGQRGDRD